MRSSGVSTLFSCALVDAFSPSSISPRLCLVAFPYVCLTLALVCQTGVCTFPQRLPVGNVCYKRTPSQSLQQSPAMAPGAVVITVTCTVSPPVRHLKPLQVSIAPSTQLTQPRRHHHVRAFYQVSSPCDEACWVSVPCRPSSTPPSWRRIQGRDTGDEWDTWWQKCLRKPSVMGQSHPGAQDVHS